MTVTLALRHNVECPRIRTQAAEEDPSVHSTNPFAKTLCQSINGLISRDALPKWRGYWSRSDCPRLPFVLEINSTSELNQKLEQIRSWTEVGSTVMCCIIQVLARSLFSVFPNACIILQFPPFPTYPGPLVYPLKCGTGKMPYINITVWHSGWMNRPVCCFKIARLQCCLFLLIKIIFHNFYMVILYPFLLLIILERMIGLSVNCLLDIEFLWTSIHKQKILSDWPVWLFGVIWLFVLRQIQHRMQNLWFWDSLLKIKFYLYTLWFITYVCIIYVKQLHMLLLCGALCCKCVAQSPLK